MTIHPWVRDRDIFQGQTKILLAEKKGGVGKVQATNSACTKWPPLTVTFRGSMLSGIQRPLRAEWLWNGWALALGHQWCLLLAPLRSSAKCVGTWWHRDLWHCYHHRLLPALCYFLRLPHLRGYNSQGQGQREPLYWVSARLKAYFLHSRSFNSHNNCQLSNIGTRL